MSDEKKVFTVTQFKDKIVEDYDFFMEHFGELGAFFSKLKEKPDCGVCMKNAVESFMTNESTIKKLTDLIGVYEIKSESKWVQNADVREYTEEEFKSFYLGNFGRNAPQHQIRMLTTYFNPETKKVTVAYQWMAKEEV
jgi:hypothetical protein